MFVGLNFDRLRIRRLTAVSMSLLLGVFQLAAEPLEMEPGEDPWLNGKQIFTLENDRLATGTDKYYTNGIRFGWVTGDLTENGAPPSPIGSIASIFPGPEVADSVYRVRFSVGQDMFTPDDISRRIPNPNDRPFAGWLYGSLGFGRYNEESVDILDLTLGMVGPASLAEPAQKYFHDLLGAQVAGDQIHGWDHQLPNEFGFMLSYQKRWLFRGELVGPFQWDVSAGGGVVLGTIETYGNLSGTLRFGYQLPDTLPVEPIAPGHSMGESLGQTLDRGFRVYLLVGVEGRAMARNVFLDGSTFQSSPSVSKEYFVGEGRFGGGIGYDWFTMEYAFVARSKEFKTQPEPQYYGSIYGSIQF